MPPQQGDKIRSKFLSFFAGREHQVLSGSSLVPNDPTVLLTIAGMLQFKRIFLGQLPREYKRVVTSQKCIRTNDIENVGKTTRHHTFFEMLGNFSFGDYFKREAIHWAWELATSEYELPAENIWISVHKDDGEAFRLWHDEIGVPEQRIQKLGDDDNFWSSGATGPCGPCSEMFFDFHPERDTNNADLGDDGRFLEFYNLVFMEFNRQENGDLEVLPQKCIDTGLGLERMARILQRVPNNYETDMLLPIIERASQLCGIDYTTSDERVKSQFKIVADHSRAVVYLLSDGVVPSNVGRGYIVRRLIRRLVRTGRQLGIKPDCEGTAALPALAKVVVDMSLAVDPEVQRNAERIYEELSREELRFVQTLDRGERLLTHKLRVSCRELSGKDAFFLYDTYGFPVEMTEEIAGERGIAVDLKGFRLELESQRMQSQMGRCVLKLSAEDTVVLLSDLPATEFIGYESLDVQTTVEALRCKGSLTSHAAEGEEVEVVLRKTTFYAEQGGQVGDNGVLHVGEDEVMCKIVVKDVQKVRGDLIIHKGVIEQGEVRVGDKVRASVDSSLRRGAKAHHTATHLLQAALKQVLGNEASQAGSLVAFDNLRFDCTVPRRMGEDEVAAVEKLVNDWTRMSVPLQSQVMPVAEAKKAGAIAMFGEKYGKEVRVVSVPGISMELCGGTHVSNTGEIQGFRITSVQGIASGVQRIEAVAGDAFVSFMFARDSVLKQLTSVVKVKPEELAYRVRTWQDELKRLKNEAARLRTSLAIAQVESLVKNSVNISVTSGARLLVAQVEATEMEALRSAAQHAADLLGDPSVVLLASCPSKEKVNLVAAVSDDVVKTTGIKACELVSLVAKTCGGNGGGRPGFAQASGKHPDKLPMAMEIAYSKLL